MNGSSRRRWDPASRPDPNSASPRTSCRTGAVVLSQPPALTGHVQSGTASISWPTNVAGFVLQSTTSLSPPVVWQDVAPPYDLSGLSFVYQDAPVGSVPRKFFRLRGPRSEERRVGK